jgi:hypothetical protein
MHGIQCPRMGVTGPDVKKPFFNPKTPFLKVITINIRYLF